MDISDILNEWPYEPGQITVRKIRGRDGREKIQLRLDLGLLQMETSGRPDGERPHGCESLLAYHERELARYRAAHEGSDEGFVLEEEDCELLRAEAVMYYHRYLAEFVLEDFEAVERDTARNIRLLDFFNAYAVEQFDRMAFEQYRPYMIMMRTRARGQRELGRERPREALAAVRKGMEEVRDFYRRYGEEEMIGASGELSVLESFAKQIRKRIPLDPRERLQRKLDKALAEERYEDAALVRDQIRAMKQSSGAEPEGSAGE